MSSYVLIIVHCTPSAQKISMIIALILSRYMQEVLFRCQGKQWNNVDLMEKK